MNAYLPIEPGWYKDKVIHPTEEENLRADEFSNPIADASVPVTEIDMSDFSYMFVHAYITIYGVTIIDEYYEGKRIDEYCISFGGALRLTHRVEIFKIDWDKAPSWAMWAGVNPLGRVKWFSRKPFVKDLSWVAPNMSRISEMDESLTFTIPPHVDWRDLLEERPLKNAA